MRYWDVPSGVLVQAGETVRMFSLLEDTVRVWPAPVPAAMKTGCAAHSFLVHDLLGSPSVVLVRILMTYWDVLSGGVVQAEARTSVLALLEDTVFAWPAPVPTAMLSGRPFHTSVVHVLVMSWSVVLVCAPVAVPASSVAVPLSPGAMPLAVPVSLAAVPASALGVRILNVAATRVSSIVSTTDPLKVALAPFTVPTNTRVLAPIGPVWLLSLHAASASVASAITPQASRTPRRVVWSPRSSSMSAPVDGVASSDANRFPRHLA